MRIAVLGRTHWLINSADRAAAEGHGIALVATTPASSEYRAKEEEFAALARRHGAPFFNGPDINDPSFVAELNASGAEVGISVNWPTLVRDDACATLHYGILNAHAGDLPRFRGNACPNWAILNAETHIGLCVHTMVPEEIDAGPVFARARLPLNDETYIGDVYAWMDEVIPTLFARALANLTAPQFMPEDQAAGGIRPLRACPRRPEDGLIDWRESADRIARLVRASSRPFAGAFSFLEDGTRVVVWRARVASLDYDVLALPGQIIGRASADGVLVAAGQGVVEIEEAQVEGLNRRLPASNRYRLTRLGSAT